MTSDWFEKMLRGGIFDLKTLTFKARVKHLNYFFAMFFFLSAALYMDTGLFSHIFLPVQLAWNSKNPSFLFFCSTCLPPTSIRWFDQCNQAFHTLRSAID